MKCRICGSEIDHETYICGQEMVDRQLCFTCNHWQNQLEADKERGDYKWAVIDGGHYVIAPEDEKTRFRGFGGQKFIIIFEDGTVVRTTNLWFQGHIPEEWKSQFPDNAVFADNRKWQKIGDCEYLAPSISTTQRGFRRAEVTIRTMVKPYLEAQQVLCDERAPSYLKENGDEAADNLQ